MCSHSILERTDFFLRFKDRWREGLLSSLPLGLVGIKKTWTTSCRKKHKDQNAERVPKQQCKSMKYGEIGVVYKVQIVRERDGVKDRWRERDRERKRDSDRAEVIQRERKITIETLSGLSVTEREEQRKRERKSGK